MGKFSIFSDFNFTVNLPQLSYQRFFSEAWEKQHSDYAFDMVLKEKNICFFPTFSAPFIYLFFKNWICFLFFFSFTNADNSLKAPVTFLGKK